MSKHEWFVNLTSEEALGRIQSATDKEAFWTWEHKGSKGFVTKITRNKFCLRKRRPRFMNTPFVYRNSFAPLFYGVVEEINDRSKISGCFRMHLSVLLFLLIWFSLIGLQYFQLLPVGFFFSNAQLKGVFIFTICLVLGGKLLGLPEKEETRSFLDDLFGDVKVVVDHE